MNFKLKIRKFESDEHDWPQLKIKILNGISNMWGMFRWNIR